MSKSMKKIITFVLLTFVLCIYFYYDIVNNGFSNSNTIGIMWMPALSGIIVKLVFDKTIKGLGWSKLKLKYSVICYLIPLIACLLVYPIVWTSGIGAVNASKIGILNLSSGLQVFIYYGTIMFLLSIITAAGEEIGWRGFLVPEMMREMTYTKTSILIGVIWNLYHLPIMILAGYNNGVSILLSFICFSISIMAVSFIVTWFRMKSESVWPATVLHASHNLFVGSFFDEMTVDKGITKIFTTEFGIGLALIYALIALYFWKKRFELRNID